MEISLENTEECKKLKMDIPVLIQVSQGDNVIYEVIGNEDGKDGLEKIRKSMEITQQDVNSFLTQLVEEERKIGAVIAESKDESSDSDHISDDDADQDLDNLIKKIPCKKTA